MGIYALTFLLFFLIATLYSSVGHAGASGYLAVMAWLSFHPEIIKPTSLILNIFVATIASVKFLKEGYFDRKIFLIFALTSIPMAFIGGYITLDVKYFKLIAGLFLILSAILLVSKAYMKPSERIRKMPIMLGLIIGGCIGFLSGLIGIGGGVFLSPIIIMAGWTSVKNASGVAALFILCNSVPALTGNISSINKIDSNVIYWIVAVIIGGFLGTYLGTKKMDNRLILTLLFFVLISAGIKFLLTLHH